MTYFTAQRNEFGPDSIVVYFVDDNGDLGFGETTRDDPKLPDFVRNLANGTTVDEHGNVVERVE